MKIRKKIGSQMSFTGGAEDNTPTVFVVRSSRRKEKVFLIQEGKNPPYLSLGRDDGIHSQVGE